MAIGEEIEDADEGLLQRILYLICSQSHILIIAFAFQMMLLTLAIMSALFADLNSATQIVLVIDFVLLAVAIAPTFGLMWYCRQN